jgi:hypothetical protein
VPIFAPVSSTNEIERRPRRRQRTGRAIGVAAINRVADRIDLAIDLLTLGQYGLECHEDAGANGCEGSKRRTRQESRVAWEAPRVPRRPGCRRVGSDAWAWPPRRATG